MPVRDDEHMYDEEFMFVNLNKACKTFGKRADDRTEGICSVSQSTIAEETGYARRTVSNSIHRLAEKNLLTVVPDYVSGWKLAPNYGEHEGVSYASNTTDDMRRLPHDMTRLHDVLADVVADILEAAEERNNK